MTEERIRELENEGYDYGQLLRIVAAEAWEGGYSNGMENIRLRSYSKLVRLSFTSGYLDPALDMVDVSGLLQAAQHELEAERLKEKK